MPSPPPWLTQIPEARGVLSGRHDGRAGKRRAGDQVLEALPPVAPRFARDVLSVDVEHVAVTGSRENLPEQCRSAKRKATLTKSTLIAEKEQVSRRPLLSVPVTDRRLDRCLPAT